MEAGIDAATIPDDIDIENVSEIEILTADVTESRQLALHVAEIISDTPAADTLVLDIHRLSTIADFFTICSGENERQLRAIANTLEARLSEAGVRPRRAEGTPESGWMVIDYGDVIVHIFAVDQRQFYRLESLWSEAPTLLTIQ